MKHGSLIFTTWVSVLSVILTVIILIWCDKRKSKKYQIEREEISKKDKEELRRLLEESKMRRLKEK